MIQVKQSKIHGKGVFATKDIPKGTVMCKDPTIVTDWAVNDLGVLVDYVYSLKNSLVVLGLGPSSLANHSSRPNSCQVISKKFVKLVAMKRIKAGEELFIDYGEDYWRARQITPTE